MLMKNEKIDKLMPLNVHNPCVIPTMYLRIKLSRLIYR